LVVRLVKVWVPLVALVPDHPPEAVHEVLLVELQVMIEELPKVTVAGLGEMVTVGTGVAGVATAKVTAVFGEVLVLASLHMT
jgi:hypothetical protein